MGHRFNPPPGWPLAAGFTPDPDWRPDPAWPAAPDGWQFWVPDEVPAPPAAAATGGKVGGFFKSLQQQAKDGDWVGKAKSAATSVQASVQQAGTQVSAAQAQADAHTLAAAGELPPGAIWRGVSHDPGRNAIITLYPDRIERSKKASKMSLSGYLGGGMDDVEVIPTKSVSSVQARRAGLYSDVTVYASGNTIVFRVDAATASQFRDLIMQQIVGGSARPAPAPPGPPPAPGPSAPATSEDVVARLKQLAELRDAGIITSEEFDAKKAELLGRL